MTIYEQISAARDCGVVRCAACKGHTLDEVAKELRLSIVPGTYRELGRAAAELLLVELLHRDLAYSVEIMPRERAETLAAEFFAGVPADAVLYSNGDAAQSGWIPATRASFDRGVLAISAGGSCGFWIEDED